MLVAELIETEEQASKALGESALGRALAARSRENLVDLYLGDFVRMVYMPQSKDDAMECEVFETGQQKKDGGL